MNFFSSLHLVLPYPPSVNHIYLRSRNGGVYLAPRYRRYLAEASASARAQAREQGIATFTDPVFVEMVMTPPAIRRRRDADNLIKATFDALTRAKVWQDDSLVERLELAFKNSSPAAKSGMAELTVAYGKPCQKQGQTMPKTRNDTHHYREIETLTICNDE